MSLVSARKMIKSARAEGCAVGYFESWNLESLQGVIDAAEQTRSPVIIGFSGDFMFHAGRKAEDRLSWFAALGKAAAASASVPTALIFNECGIDDRIREAIDSGFNIVSLTDLDESPENYISRATKLTQYAHDRNAAAEAEIGELSCGADGEGDDDGCPTNPSSAADFVKKTGVDFLAVSVGNVHIRLKGHTGLDLDLLGDIYKRVNIPLVLHGGTGISPDALRKAISLGVAKVNYGTCIKQRYLEAVRPALSNSEANPHKLLGLGGEEDTLVIGRHAIRDEVVARMEHLGCYGKA